MTQPAQFYIGQMSGTSLDGVDSVIVAISSPTECELIAHHHLPFPDGIKKWALDLCRRGEDELNQSRLLATALSELYAQAIHEMLNRAQMSPRQILAIGCHGQTVRHMPPHYSIQLIDAARLAELCDITVVTDFRSRDIAAKGQGAPLVPAFHQAVFASEQFNRVIANIGGMANISVLSGGAIQSGFDTGPGNVLLDEWYQSHNEGSYDKDGHWAASGQIIPHLLDKFLSDTYFKQPPPKSTGREYFNQQWLSRFPVNDFRPEDVQATLTALTAQSICDAASQWQYPSLESELIICGGGVENTELMKMMERILPTWSIKRSDALGVDAQWVEAMAFGWLGYCCLNQLSGNVPTVTGAKGERVLGAIYPA